MQDGYTALMLAAESRAFDTVEKLLEMNANVDEVEDKVNFSSKKQTILAIISSTWIYALTCTGPSNGAHVSGSIQSF